MKDYSPRKIRASIPLPYFLLAGLLVGIGIGWTLFNIPVSPARHIPFETPTYTPKHVKTTSTEIPQSVGISPEVNFQSTTRVGKPAPDFTLKTIDGKVVKLSYFKGQAVLINMWASWCPPCRDEMPGIQTAYEKYKDKGLVVLGINFTVQDNLADVKSFVEELKLTFPILLDETGEVSAGWYGMRALPTSYFVDAHGVIQRIQVGAMLPDKLAEFLDEIIPR